MENHVSIAEAKRNFSSLINQVAYGKQPITITSRNKPKVVIVSIDGFENKKAAQEVTKYQERKKAAKLADRVHDRLSKKIKTDPVDVLRQTRDDRTTQLLTNLH